MNAWGTFWGDSWGTSWGPLHEVEEHPELAPAGVSPAAWLILSRACEVITKSAAVVVTSGGFTAEGFARVPDQRVGEAECLPCAGIRLRWARIRASGGCVTSTRARRVTATCGVVRASASGSADTQSLVGGFVSGAVTASARATVRMPGATAQAGFGHTTAAGREGLSEAMALVLYNRLRKQRNVLLTRKHSGI